MHDNSRVKKTIDQYSLVLHILLGEHLLTLKYFLKQVREKSADTQEDIK